MPDNLPLVPVSIEAALALPDSRAAFVQAAETVIAAKRTAGTRRAYAYELRSWLDFCDRSGLDPARATLQLATQYRDELLQVRSAASVHRACAALSAVYKPLFRARVAAANPWSSEVLAWPSAAPMNPTPASNDDDVRAMIKAATNDLDPWTGARDAALITLIWTTGVRRSSAATAKLEDLHREADRTTLRVWVKGGRLQDIELVAEAEAALQHWLSVRGTHVGPLLPKRHDDSEPLSGDGVYRVLVRRAREAGCSHHVSPHMLRAGFATLGFDLGLPVYEVQGALGHARSSTTLRYDRGQRGARAFDAVATKRRSGP